MKNLFVGNLDSMVTHAELWRLFEAYGQVAQVHVIVDRDTGLPRYAFVEMLNDADAEKAIEELKGSILRGRALNVEYARPRPERPAAELAGTAMQRTRELVTAEMGGNLAMPKDTAIWIRTSQDVGELMERDGLLPEYRNGGPVGWTCSRYGWKTKRDSSVLEVDDLARAPAEFLDHTCSPSEHGT